jgi:Type I phosphodiesterase / nucleotide pyrophosphatase
MLRQDCPMAWGLAQVANSIFAGLSVTGTSDEIGVGESPTGRECFLLVDGLGLSAVEQYGTEFPIFSHFSLRRDLISHFPSTTATNISSFGTGLFPGVHGMLGYTVRVPHSGEPGRLLNALKWDERVDPVMWQNRPTLFERAAREGVTVTHIAAKRYEGSGFTQAVLRGARYLGANRMEEMVEAAIDALAQPNSFTYLYINNVDAAGHEYGVGSAKWREAIALTADLLSSLTSRLPRGTRLWVSADHGMINVGDGEDQKIVLGRGNHLLDGVSMIGGEPRARHLYLHEGALEQTRAIWEETLGDGVLLFGKNDALRLFGDDVRDESYDRMGDLIAVPRGNKILVDPERVRQESSMVGHHGGMNEEELAIPLLSTVIGG